MEWKITYPAEPKLFSLESDPNEEVHGNHVPPALRHQIGSQTSLPRPKFGPLIVTSSYWSSTPPGSRRDRCTSINQRVRFDIQTYNLIDDKLLHKGVRTRHFRKPIPTLATLRGTVPTLTRRVENRRDSRVPSRLVAGINKTWLKFDEFFWLAVHFGFIGSFTRWEDRSEKVLRRYVLCSR